MKTVTETKATSGTGIRTCQKTTFWELFHFMRNLCFGVAK